MSTTLTNMGLVSWTSGNDFFSSGDLSANWSKVDAHDHTTGKGVQIPTAGLANGAVTGAKLAADAVDGSKILDGSVSSAELGSNSVTTVKITDANVTDAKLASPNNGVQRTLIQSSGITNALAAGTYGLSNQQLISSGASIAVGTVAVGVPVFHYIAGDHAVTGKTSSFRVKATLACNSISPTQTWTFGLYPFTVAGASGNIAITLGTVVTGSTAVISSIPGNAIQYAESSDFTISSGTDFLLGVVLSGALTTGNVVNVSSRLVLHHT